MKRLLFLLSVILPIMAQSAIVQIDGINYELKESKKTASVASGEYSGEITIPSQVTYENITYEVVAIKSSAFAGTQITKITLPSSINTIHIEAFEDCTSLNTITISGTPTISAGAFRGCSGLARVYYNGSMKGWCSIVFDGETATPMCHATELYINNVIVNKGTLTIPEDVTYIGDYTFYNLQRITAVSFPSNSLLSIGGNAFANCINLASLTIPNSVKSIDGGAFYNCSKLSSATLGSGLNSIRIATFGSCTSLKNIHIPNSITSIEERAFVLCTSLEEVLIPNSVLTLGDQAFGSCSKLQNVTLSTNLKQINPEVFLKCSALQSIIIPNGVSIIGKSAFEECSKLVDVIMPNTLTTIEQAAFRVCRALPTITLPNSLETINLAAFLGCSNLHTIDMGTRLISIKESVFSYCNQLTDVTVRATTPPTIESSTFPANSSMIVKVPCKSLDTYKEELYWQDLNLEGFGGDCSGSVTNYTVSVSSANTSMGIVSGGGKYKEGTTATVTATPKSGYKFTKWSDGTTKNPYTFTVTKDVSLIAYFEKESSSSTNEITCEEAAEIAASLPHNTPTAETYTVIGYVTETDGVISREQQRFWMADTPNGGNVFQSYWGNVTEAVSVGDKVSLTGQIMQYNSTYQIKNGDVVILAYGYSPEIYSVTVSSANTSMGTVSGGGEYEEGTTATVTATPKSGYKFTKWSDGTTKNPYTFTVTKDISLTAYFEKESSSGTYEITCEEAAEIAASLPHNTPTTETYTVIGYVTETDGVISREQQRFWMADTPNGGNVFQSYWGNVTEAVAVGDKVSLTGQIMRYNSTYQIKNGDVVILAYGYSPEIYSVTVSSANTSMGTVSGGGEYEEGTTATITATPKSGYKFTKWSDGTTKNPYTFTVTKDISLTAYFEKESSSGTYKITCEEAAAIAAALLHNTPTAETYTVIGYVTETDGVISREQQRFWMADTPNGGNVFQSYWGNVTEAVSVGDKVSLTGQIMRYNSTYQIKNGDVVLLQPKAQNVFWNFSNAEFNSLGTISSTKTVDGLTINATSSGTVVVDASSQTIDNISFTHRLKLNGTGSANYRSLKFNITGDCTIDIYLKSANSSENRTLRIDFGTFNSNNYQKTSATASIAKSTISYTGEATTVYVYGTIGGVNLYGIRVNYNSSTNPDVPREVTCKEAADIAAELEHNTPTYETYTVVGYVTETNGYVTDQSRQVFWMADTKNGGQIFQSYYGNVTEAVKVGDYVSLTGQIKRYNSTPQIQHGNVVVLSQETGVDDLIIHQNASKILRNGQLLILRDGKTYNVMGQEL